MSQSTPAGPSADARISVRAHAPERSRSPHPVVMNCGCSCCCCCLHSVGGVIGAIVAMAKSGPVVVPGPKPHIGVLYWMVFQIVNGVIFMIGGRDSEGAILVVLLLLPGIQLLTSLICCGLLATTTDQRGPRLRKLGRVTFWGFVGSLIGLGVMVGLGLLLGALR